MINNKCSNEIELNSEVTEGICGDVRQWLSKDNAIRLACSVDIISFVY